MRKPGELTSHHPKHGDMARCPDIKTTGLAKSVKRPLRPMSARVKGSSQHVSPKARLKKFPRSQARSGKKLRKAAKSRAPGPINFNHGPKINTYHSKAYSPIISTSKTEKEGFGFPLRVATDADDETMHHPVLSSLVSSPVASSPRYRSTSPAASSPRPQSASPVSRARPQSAMLRISTAKNAPDVNVKIDSKGNQVGNYAKYLSRTHKEQHKRDRKPCSHTINFKEARNRLMREFLKKKVETYAYAAFKR